MILVTRDQWGARDPRDPHTPIQTPSAHLILHHFAADWPGAAGMRRCQDLHMDDRGYDDVAYSMMVDADAVYVGRGPGVQGAHTKGWNRDAHAVAAAIDGASHVADAVLDRLAEAAVWLWQQGAVEAPFYDGGHRDFGASECPGDALHDQLGEINRRAARLALTQEYPVDAMILVHPSIGTPDALASLTGIFMRPDQKVAVTCNVDALLDAKRAGKRVYAVGGPAADLVEGETELRGTTRLDTLEQVLEQSERGW